MALTKSAPTNIFATTTLATETSGVSNAHDVTTAAAADIEVLIEGSSAPTAGTVDVAIYDSLDGTNFTNDPVYTGYATPREVPYRATFPIEVTAFRYIQVSVTNNTDVSVDVTINITTTAP